MNGKIYKITCKPTRKAYIGQTKQPISIRIKHHFTLSKRLTEYPMYADMCKYPDSDFVYEILHQNITDKDELNHLEKEEIGKHGTLEPDGYNQHHNKRRVYKRGKEHHSYGIPRSESTKRKIAAYRKGKKHSPETIAKIKASLKRRRETTCNI